MAISLSLLEELSLEPGLNAEDFPSADFTTRFYKAVHLPLNQKKQKISSICLNGHFISTPVGPMIAIGSNDHLYLLEFMSRKGLLQEIINIRHKVGAAIEPQSNPLLNHIKQELAAYFSGKLTSFITPIHLIGTSFQESVWKQLQQIPYGQTRSYKELASMLSLPQGFRAVAKANSTNHLAIIVPCHRVIYANQSLGGYAGGVLIKQQLLDHEKHPLF